MSLKQIRAVWDTTELVVEELVQSAEALTSTGGAEKKAFVKAKAIEYLRALEGKVDVLPAALEGIVFKAIEFALDHIIERVLRRLDRAGVVNAT